MEFNMTTWGVLAITIILVALIAVVTFAMVIARAIKVKRIEKAIIKFLAQNSEIREQINLGQISWVSIHGLGHRKFCENEKFCWELEMEQVEIERGTDGEPKFFCYCSFRNINLVIDEKKVSNCQFYIE